MTDEIKSYVKRMTERVEIYEKAKENISKIYKKTVDFAQYYIIGNPSEQTKDLTKDSITYKTIKYLIDEEYDVSQEAKDWMEENKSFIEAIEEFEKSVDEPFNSEDLKNYYIVGSTIPEILDSNLINSIFRPDLFASARSELTKVQETIELVMLKRKIDTLAESSLRSLYYDITNIAETKHLEYLQKEMKTVETRYSNDAILENLDYQTDPYYLSLKKQLAAAHQKKDEQWEYIESIPIEVIKDNMYTMLSDGKDDYEKVRKGNAAKETLTNSGFDVSNLDKEIEKAATKLYILGIDTEDNNEVNEYNLETLRNLYNIAKRTKQSCGDYETFLNDTKVYGLINSISAYLKYLKDLRNTQAKKEAIKNGISLSKKSRKEYDRMIILEKVLSKKARRLKDIADNIDDLEAENAQLATLEKDRTDVLTEQLAKVQMDLIKFKDHYNAGLESPSKYCYITSVINSFMGIEKDDFQSNYMVKTILSGSKPTEEINDQIIALSKKVISGENTITNYMVAEQDSCQEYMDDVTEKFNESINLFPNFVEKGVTIETITPTDIKEEQQNQLSYYELLCSAREAQEDTLVDKAFEIMTAAEENSDSEPKNMSNDEFYEKVRQYVKKVNDYQSQKQN